MTFSWMEIRDDKALRKLCINGDWKDFWSFLIDSKKERLYTKKPRKRPREMLHAHILSAKVNKASKSHRYTSIIPCSHLPDNFKLRLRKDSTAYELWNNADPLNDRSVHDWMLGMRCIEEGTSKPEELASIMVNNPHGKFQRDKRLDYVRVTVGKLLDVKAENCDWLRHCRPRHSSQCQPTHLNQSVF